MSDDNGKIIKFPKKKRPANVIPIRPEIKEGKLLKFKKKKSTHALANLETKLGRGRPPGPLSPKKIDSSKGRKMSFMEKIKNAKDEVDKTLAEKKKTNVIPIEKGGKPKPRTGPKEGKLLKFPEKKKPPTKPPGKILKFPLERVKPSTGLKAGELDFIPTEKGVKWNRNKINQEKTALAKEKLALAKEKVNKFRPFHPRKTVSAKDKLAGARRLHKKVISKDLLDRRTKTSRNKDAAKKYIEKLQRDYGGNKDVRELVDRYNRQKNVSPLKHYQEPLKHYQEPPKKAGGFGKALKTAGKAARIAGRVAGVVGAASTAYEVGRAARRLKESMKDAPMMQKPGLFSKEMKEAEKKKWKGRDKYRQIKKKDDYRDYVKSLGRK